MQTRDKVFVVTGGGNGIGREVVLALLARGAAVAAVDLSAEALAETAELAGVSARLSTHAVDVTDRSAVQELRSAVLAEHGAVDGLVNVAGIIHRFARVNDLEYAEIEKVMAVNFWGVVHTSKTFLPDLLDRPTASLVNVASMGALAPVPGQSAYGASKAAVKLFTEGLYAELLGTGVAVTIVFPGGVGTGITTNSGVEVPGRSADSAGTSMKLTTAVDAGRQIVRAIEQGTFRVRIGNDAKLIDRLSRAMPKRATELIAKKMASLLG